MPKPKAFTIGKYGEVNSKNQINMALNIFNSVRVSRKLHMKH